MYGPIDVDSLEFQTRVQIRLLSEVTDVSRNEVVTRAVEELYRRVMEQRELTKATSQSKDRPQVHSA
jgi:hypothetical protein